VPENRHPADKTVTSAARAASVAADRSWERIPEMLVILEAKAHE
jgi:hypothetical protein